MIPAYNKSYLEKAQITLGRMLDYAVYDLKYDIEEFWQLFLSSNISKQIETGNITFIAGKSGVELALEVIGEYGDYITPTYSLERSQEYWTGWALAYFQWTSSLSFKQITQIISIKDIMSLYNPYHEMDIRHFCDKISQLYIQRKKLTNLKERRLAVGISQSQLASITCIPLRTIQQYEQGQKNINKARSEYIIALAKALYCDPQLLLEYQPTSND